MPAPKKSKFLALTWTMERDGLVWIGLKPGLIKVPGAITLEMIEKSEAGEFYPFVIGDRYSYDPQRHEYVFEMTEIPDYVAGQPPAETE